MVKGLGGKGLFGEENVVVERGFIILMLLLMLIIIRCLPRKDK